MTHVVLVTGGFGYIGGRVAQHLAKTAGVSLRLATRNAGADAPAWLPQAAVVTLDLDDEAAVTAACRGATALHSMNMTARPIRSVRCRSTAPAR